MSTRLPFETYLETVRHAPLVAIDLIVEGADGLFLLGLRKKNPASGSWFVLGGRIYKDESLDHAFARISHDELGVELARGDARFLGVDEHFYDENAGGLPGFGTHYVVLGYCIKCDRSSLALPEDQHSDYRWFQRDELLQDSQVHPNTRRYFEAFEPV
ncbi:MAG: GDP-mannose mannosyl hydrolase [Acidobacteriota bacterium]|nr:GDP-mannose mannosyl hydrolase [Acidobacteriota bacterium]